MKFIKVILIFIIFNFGCFKFCFSMGEPELINLSTGKKHKKIKNNIDFLIFFFTNENYKLFKLGYLSLSFLKNYYCNSQKEFSNSIKNFLIKKINEFDFLLLEGELYNQDKICFDGYILTKIKNKSIIKYLNNFILYQKTINENYYEEQKYKKKINKKFNKLDKKLNLTDSELQEYKDLKKKVKKL